MKEIRCPICNDIITEEDIVVRDPEGNITFRHCGQYFNLSKDRKLNFSFDSLAKLLVTFIEYR